MPNDPLTTPPMSGDTRGLSPDEQRIVDWLRAGYADAIQRGGSMPVNAMSMMDTIRKLIEEGAHRQ